MNLIYISALFVALSCLTAEVVLAEIKTFTKEYTYQASELDSKSTSRTLALEQAKRMLLEELGVFLISQTEVVNSALTKDQITSITAGIVSAEVLDERWDGHNYWLKAKIDADPTVVKQAIEIIANDTKKTSELEAARKRIAELTQNLEAVKNDLGSTQDERKKRYTKVVNQKEAMDWLVTFYNTFNNKKSLAENKEALDAIDKAIGIDPDSAVAYVLRAYIYGDIAKDTQKAIDDISKAIKFHAPGPNTPFQNTAEHYEYRAQLYLRQGMHSQAFADLMTALEIDPTDILQPFAQWKAADLNAFVEKHPKDYRAYIFRGRYNSHYLSDSENPNAFDMAISDLKKALKMNSKNPLIYYILIDPYRYKARFYDIRHPYERVDLVNHNAVIDLATKGLKLSNTGLWQKRFFRVRAEEYLILKNFQSAIADYNELEKLDSKYGGTFYDRGLAKKGAKDYSGAITDFNRAIAVKTKAYLGNDWIFEQVAETYSEQGSTLEAILNFSNAIDYRGKNRETERALNIKGLPLEDDIMLAGLYEKRGWQYELINDYGKALKDYSDAINYLKGNGTALSKRADLLAALGRYEEAFADIGTMMESFHKYDINPAELYFKRGNIYAYKGDIKNAINDYDRTLYYDKEFSAVYEQRGILYLNLGNAEQALKDFDECVKAFPKYARAYSLRGGAYINTGNNRKALEDLNQAISLNPKSEIAYHYRAEVHDNLSDRVKARNDYKTAARLGYKPAQDHLKSIGETW